MHTHILIKPFENFYHPEKFIILYNFSQPPKEIKIELYGGIIYYKVGSFKSEVCLCMYWLYKQSDHKKTKIKVNNPMGNVYK